MSASRTSREVGKPLFSSARLRRAQRLRTFGSLPSYIIITGGADRYRTDGLVVANDALSQLSYSPTCKKPTTLLRNTELKRPCSRSEQTLNQLISHLVSSVRRTDTAPYTLMRIKFYIKTRSKSRRNNWRRERDLTTSSARPSAIRGLVRRSIL
jgi:hypothetical protein